MEPIAPLVFTPDARRLLAITLLAEEDDRVMPAEDNEDASVILGLLSDLGLPELQAGGYVPTEALRLQSWAEELKRRPFPD
jgi:hypothetical protein